MEFVKNWKTIGWKGNTVFDLWGNYITQKNLFTFFSNVRLFMANSKINVENGAKIVFAPKSTKIKIELDILKVSSHLPMALRSLNFKFFIEIEFVGNYEDIKLLLSGLTIII